MASTNPAFNPEVFREKIRAAMVMGLPNNVADRATFRWTTQKTFSRHDSGGSPFDLTATPVATTVHADVQVAVAVEFQALRTQNQQNPVGEFDAGRVIITVLDEEYAQIAGADQVLLGQNVYDVEFVAPPIGLFEVDVFQIYARARDES